MPSFSSKDAEQVKKQVPVAEGLFYQPSSAEEKPYLIGARCSRCSYTAFPRIPICPRCGVKDTMQEYHLGQKGKIESFTVVWSPLPGFKAPSVQSLIKLDEGLTIWSLVTGCEPQEGALEIGMDVELVIDKVREDQEGREIVSYQYKPVKKN